MVNTILESNSNEYTHEILEQILELSEGNNVSVENAKVDVTTMNLVVPSVISERSILNVFTNPTSIEAKLFIFDPSKHRFIQKHTVFNEFQFGSYVLDVHIEAAISKK